MWKASRQDKSQAKKSGSTVFYRDIITNRYRAARGGAGVSVVFQAGAIDTLEDLIVKYAELKSYSEKALKELIRQPD